MKLANLEVAGAPRVGVVDDKELRLLPAGTEMMEVLCLEPAERKRRAAAATESVEPAGAKLLPSIQPRTLRDFITFESHVEGVIRRADPDAQVPDIWYESPAYYFSNSNAAFGQHAEIEVPPGCQELDFELEIGLIVGKDGRDLRPDESARDHIAGFTIFNDYSARDFGTREARLAIGWTKAKDFANSFGPWVVTADEFDRYRKGDRYDVKGDAYLNGERVGGESFANMSWSFEEMLAYASRGAELKVGDVLGSGTCGGGCLAELWGRRGEMEPPPLSAGDEVRFEVEGIGTLVNTIVAGVEPIPVPPAVMKR